MNLGTSNNPFRRSKEEKSPTLKARLYGCWGNGETRETKRKLGLPVLKRFGLGNVTALELEFLNYLVLGLP
jgi:hypothetical protein